MILIINPFRSIAHRFVTLTPRCRPRQRIVVVIQIFKSVRIRQRLRILAVNAIIRGHRYTSLPPAGLLVLRSSGGTGAADGRACRPIGSGRGLHVLVVVKVAVLADQPADKPSATQVLRIHDAAAAQLDALPRPVHPREIDVQRGLDDAEDDGNGVEVVLCLVRRSRDPVQDVEGAVGAKADEVV